MVSSNKSKAIQLVPGHTIDLCFSPLVVKFPPLAERLFKSCCGNQFQMRMRHEHDAQERAEERAELRENLRETMDKKKENATVGSSKATIRCEQFIFLLLRSLLFRAAFQS